MGLEWEERDGSCVLGDASCHGRGKGHHSLSQLTCLTCGHPRGEQQMQRQQRAVCSPRVSCTFSPGMQGSVWYVKPLLGQAFYCLYSKSLSSAEFQLTPSPFPACSVLGAGNTNYPTRKCSQHPALSIPTSSSHSAKTEPG